MECSYKRKVNRNKNAYLRQISKNLTLYKEPEKGQMKPKVSRVNKQDQSRNEKD